MEFRYSFGFLPICWENTFSFFRLKSVNTAAVTEQTTEAFDWKLIGFIQRDRIHWNFSHSISMVCKSWPIILANVNKNMITFSALLALCEGNPTAPVDSSHKYQRRGALMFSLICTWTNGWANKWNACDLRRHCAHYEITVMNIWRFADDIMKSVLLIHYVTVLTKSSIDKSVLVQLMAWHETNNHTKTNKWTAWWRHQMEKFIALLAFVWRILGLRVNSPHKGPWRGTLMFSLICTSTNDSVNNRDAGDLGRIEPIMSSLEWCGLLFGCITIDLPDIKSTRHVKG